MTAGQYDSFSLCASLPISRPSQHNKALNLLHFIMTKIFHACRTQDGRPVPPHRSRPIQLSLEEEHIALQKNMQLLRKASGMESEMSTIVEQCTNIVSRHDEQIEQAISLAALLRMPCKDSCPMPQTEEVARQEAIALGRKKDANIDEFYKLREARDDIIRQAKISIIQASNSIDELVASDSPMPKIIRRVFDERNKRLDEIAEVEERYLLPFMHMVLKRLDTRCKASGT
ncbi:hypothetical protein GGR57DRAFT_516625 [Xylariaceae sp. FL1272]|nr:hypothetical protein GGR57DRAFT_516625 [Xylariaceae sp. FL1272]